MRVTNPGTRLPPFKGSYIWDPAAISRAALGVNTTIPAVDGNILTLGVGTHRINSVFLVEWMLQVLDSGGGGPGTVATSLDMTGTAGFEWWRNTSDGVVLRQSYVLNEVFAMTGYTMLHLTSEGTVTFRLRAFATATGAQPVAEATNTRLQRLVYGGDD